MRKGLSYVMFEKDSCFNKRKQGYALTLQQVREREKKIDREIVMERKITIKTIHYILFNTRKSKCFF